MDSIQRYLAEVENAVKQLPLESISIVVARLYDAWKERKQVFILGNGGSASTASHMANDFAKATIVPGKHRMKVIALTDCISLITAWANDLSYESIFREQLENLLEPGDVVIGISASGNSANVLRAVDFARQKGALTIGWTGLSGGQLRTRVDHCVCAPSDDVGMIESIHLILDHLVAKELLARFWMKEDSTPEVQTLTALFASE